MDCPRCGAVLRERGPNRKWKPFFECRECCRTFELVTERRFLRTAPQSAYTKFMRHTTTLQPGRTPTWRQK